LFEGGKVTKPVGISKTVLKILKNRFYLIEGNITAAQYKDG
jgi:hypothetical protein